MYNMCKNRDQCGPDDVDDLLCYAGRRVSVVTKDGNSHQSQSFVITGNGPDQMSPCAFMIQMAAASQNKSLSI